MDSRSFVRLIALEHSNKSYSYIRSFIALEHGNSVSVI